MKKKNLGAYSTSSSRAKRSSSNPKEREKSATPQVSSKLDISERNTEGKLAAKQIGDNNSNNKIKDDPLKSKRSSRIIRRKEDKIERMEATDLDVRSGAGRANTEYLSKAESGGVTFSVESSNDKSQVSTKPQISQLRSTSSPKLSANITHKKNVHSQNQAISVSETQQLPLVSPRSISTSSLSSSPSIVSLSLPQYIASLIL